MKVRWSDIAVNELEAIFLYIIEHNRSSAEKVARRIIDRANSLAEFPLVGPPANHRGTRRLIIANYPYAIYYTIDRAAGEVLIASVRHTARKQSPAED